MGHGPSQDRGNFTGQSFLWCCVASFGIAECLLFAWAVLVRLGLRRIDGELDIESEDAEEWQRMKVAEYPSEDDIKSGKLDRQKRFYVWLEETKLMLRSALVFLYVWMHDLTLGIVTLMAVAWTDAESLRPKADSQSAIVLSLCCLAHWVLLLLRLRAFPWLGKRLLPVMKSVRPVAGMGVIVFFLAIGFLHAYWALHLSEGNEVMVHDVLLFLFAGEPFPALQRLEDVDDDGKRFYTVVLAICSLLVVLCCTLNIVIAVLTDIYDQEQDRVVCRFLQERARICAMLFMRPNAKVIQGSHRAHASPSSIYACYSGVVVVLGSSLFAALLHANISLGLTAWAAAMVMALAIVLLQGMLRAMLTDRWDKLHLWFCHETHIDESTFLIDTDRHSSMQDGRLKRIRDEVYKQGKSSNRKLHSLMNLLGQSTRDQSREKDLPQLEREHSATTAATSSSWNSGSDLNDARERHTRPELPGVARRPHPIQAALGDIAHGEMMSSGMARDAQDLVREVVDVRQSLEHMQYRFVDQERRQQNLQNTCDRTLKRLGDIMKKASDRPSDGHMDTVERKFASYIPLESLQLPPSVAPPLPPPNYPYEAYELD